MRTINFNEEDIKQCKLALAKQNLTSLQSAFLMQYITNIEQENKQLKDNWNKLKECLKDVMNGSEADDKEFVETILDIIQEIEQGSDSNE